MSSLFQTPNAEEANEPQGPVRIYWCCALPDVFTGPRSNYLLGPSMTRHCYIGIRSVCLLFAF